MDLKHLEFPDSIKNPQNLNISQSYFEQEIAKILTGYGYHKSVYDAVDELRGQGTNISSISDAFETFAQDWGAPCSCPLDPKKPHFGHTTFDGRSCDYSSSDAVSELIASMETPESVKIEIQRRIFLLVDKAIPEDKNGKLSLGLVQADELLRIAEFPTKRELLRQIVSYFKGRVASPDQVLEIIRNTFVHRAHSREFRNIWQDPSLTYVVKVERVEALYKSIISQCFNPGDIYTPSSPEWRKEDVGIDKQ